MNPLEGRKALDLMERQVGEFGAKAFKFYNVRYDYGTALPVADGRPADRLPGLREGAGAGVNLIGVHKGVPLGPQPIEHTQTWDMDGAAANFPDINFVIFHVGLPFIDETCWQLIRYPNLYASLAATINFLVRSPRMFAEIIGKLLFWCGEDKIIYGSEAPIFHPQWALRAFMDFQIPQDLCDGLRLPAAHRPGQAQDPRREPAPAARHGRGADQGEGSAAPAGPDQGRGWLASPGWVLSSLTWPAGQPASTATASARRSRPPQGTAAPARPGRGRARSPVPADWP